MLGLESYLSSCLWKCKLPALAGAGHTRSRCWMAGCWNLQQSSLQEPWPPGSRELQRGAGKRPLSKDPERKPRAGLLVLLQEFEGGVGSRDNS